MYIPYTRGQPIIGVAPLSSELSINENNKSLGCFTVSQESSYYSQILHFLQDQIISVQIFCEFISFRQSSMHRFKRTVYSVVQTLKNKKQTWKATAGKKEILDVREDKTTTKDVTIGWQLWEKADSAVLEEITVMSHLQHL